MYSSFENTTYKDYLSHFREKLKTYANFLLNLNVHIL